MNGFLIFYGIVCYIANIIFSGWLAGQKNRNVGLWCFLALIFPGLAIIGIAGSEVD